MFSFFIFNSLCAECRNLNTVLGVHHVTETISAKTELCINITQFPFYIVFFDFPEGLTYYEYYSRSQKRQTTRDVVFNKANHPPYRAIELPYGSITFSTNLDELTFEFTYASLPGYCQTGIYMNTAANDEIVLSPQGKGFNQLGNYDDKCFIYAVPSRQTIIVKQSSLDENDRVFLHKSYTYADTFSGNVTEEWEYGNETITPFVRVLTRKGDPPTSLKIVMKSSAIGAEDPTSVVHIPRGRKIECERPVTWYSEDLVIMLISCCSFFLLVFILLISCRVMDKNSQKNP